MKFANVEGNEKQRLKLLRNCKTGRGIQELDVKKIFKRNEDF